MSVAEVRACFTSDATKSGQKFVNPEKEGHGRVDITTCEDIDRGSFLSLPRTGENPLQWIQLLHVLDQQGNSNFSNGTKWDSCVEGKERGLDLCKGVSSFRSDMNVVKDSVSLKSSGLPLQSTKNTSQQIQVLNIPEAVVAFVQATAKTNGEPEKYLPGWPLLSPSKVQQQKCDKCPREFCSTINYRRHIRVHRRSLNIEKDSPKNRELLGAFWDKLSLDEAKEILSLKNVDIEEVTGTAIIKALTSLIRNPGVFSLPEIYVKAGMTLLDVVQTSSSRLSISSDELFSVLDDASEKTFLCAGTATSMQKFVFDGNTGKMPLEMKNIIACTCFMVEQKLVKAWLVDKDAEALRCHKLLVEEEEAAQKRQAELLERKRLKKLRQKEQKERELDDKNKVYFKARSPETFEGTSGSTSSPSSPSESYLNTVEASSLYEDPLSIDFSRIPDRYVEANSRLHLHTEDADQSVDHQLQMGSDQQAAPDLRLHLPMEDADLNVDHVLLMGAAQSQQISARWPPPNPIRRFQNGSHSGQVSAVKCSALTNHGSYRDPKAATLANGHRIWTRKTKHGKQEESANSRDEVNLEHREEPKEQMDSSDKCEVLIGSISVKLEDDNGHQRDAISLRNNSQQKMARHDSSLNGVNRSVVKLWRPVRSHRSGVSATVVSDRRETNVEKFHAETANHILTDESRPSSGVLDDDAYESCKDSSMVLESADLFGPSLFSSQVAEAFLTQRWKAAIAADHVMLPLSPETEVSDCLDITSHQGNCAEAPVKTPDIRGRSILGSAENRMAGPGSFAKPSKPEKSHRMKYVPKQQRNNVRKRDLVARES